MAAKFTILAIMLTMLACNAQAKLPAVNTPHPKKVAHTIAPTGYALGNVEIRNTPEANGDPSWNVGYLTNGDAVQQIECVTVGNAVWVRHETGWSVVRNLGGVYIAGVCLPAP